MEENSQNGVVETNAAENAEIQNTNTEINAAVEIEEAAKTEERATEEEKPTEQESEPDYSNFSREELIESLKQLLSGEDISKIRTAVGAIRTRFNELTDALQKEKTTEEAETEETEEDTLMQSFRKLYDEYRTRRQQHLAQIEEQKKSNLEAKQALVEELRALVDTDTDQVRAALEKFNEIQERWRNIGEVPRDAMNNLWQNYHFQIEQFFSKLKINRELRELDQKRNLEQKIALCEQAEAVIVEPSVGQAFKTLQELRAKWKEIGPVPAEHNDEIWQRFQAAAAEIDKRRQEYYEQRKEELDNNLLAKQALIDKATELTQNTPGTTKEWNEMSEALDEMLKMWKSIGAVPREQNEEIWKQFKSILDKHYAAKKEYFSNIRDEQSANYQKKLELCLRAEAIAKREDWKKATEELLELQKEWKNIGTTSRKVSEKVWQRFRGACDEFFEKKSAFFAEKHSNEAENLVKKESILSELKEHVFTDDRQESLNVIKEFQRRWFEAGYVPSADKDRLQKEFRSYIDSVLEKLNIQAKEAAESNYREHISNGIAKSKTFVNQERAEIMKKIEKMRADIALWENNLGFLSSSKQADLLKAEFEKKMQGTRQQIALLQAKLRILKEAQDSTEEKEAAENAE